MHHVNNLAWINNMKVHPILILLSFLFGMMMGFLLANVLWQQRISDAHLTWDYEPESWDYYMIPVEQAFEHGDVTVEQFNNIAEAINIMVNDTLMDTDSIEYFVKVAITRCCYVEGNYLPFIFDEDGARLNEADTKVE